MSRKRTAVTILVGLSVLLTVAASSQAKHSPVTSVGGFSSQVSKNKAVVGARISVSRHRAKPGVSQPPASGGSPAAPTDRVILPSLPSDSPLLQNPAPAGPGTFWYQPSPGQACIYIAAASPDCYTVVTAGGGGAPDVSAMAAQLAEQFDLSLAGIEASPAASRDGLTGAPSWFWLAKAPGEQQRSITLAGETVTVTAEPSQISWSFGDATSLVGGPGVSYQAGTPPPAAITHVYQTRCLPGDQGHDPYVLASCANDGYHVLASTTWTISFAASGPVNQTGQLPARSTASGLVYPVSEVRGFLSGGTP